MYEIILQLPFNGLQLKGVLSMPVTAKSIIVFSLGFENQSHPHEQKMALKFQKEGFATLVFDLLDQNEELPESYKDISLLGHGLATATNWLHNNSEYRDMDLAYFGSGSGAATALKACTQVGLIIKTVVTLSGRLDLVQKDLRHISSPVLLIVGEFDFKGIDVNRKALTHLKTQKQLAIVPAASHLFEEPGKMKEATKIALSWFKKYLPVDLKPRIFY